MQKAYRSPGKKQKGRHKKGIMILAQGGRHLFKHYIEKIIQDEIVKGVKQAYYKGYRNKKLSFRHIKVEKVVSRKKSSQEIF